MSTKLQPVKASVLPLVRIDAHYRKALSFRWQELVIRACIVTAVAFLLVPGVLLGWRPSLLTFFGLLLLTPILYLVTTHIILRSRRSWIESPPLLPASSSALSVWFGTFAPRVVALLGTHVLAAILFALAFSSVQNLLRPSSGLGWSSATTPRYPWHWNERLWFLVFGNTVFIGLLALRDVLARNIGPKWPQKRAAFPMVIQQALARLFSVVYTVLYFTFRRPVWRMAVTYLPFLRPFAINFAKKGSLSWGLAYYLLVLQITALFAVQPALAVVNDYLCQPLPFSSFTRKSPLSADKYLLTALESTNQFYLNHTVIELQRVAHTVKRRKEIFADTSRPALVHDLFRAILLILGDSYTTLAAKGRKSTSPTTAPARPVQDSHSMAVKSADIFRPVSKPGALEGFVSTVLKGKPAPTPEPVRTALKRAHEAEVAVAKKVEADAPALERAVDRTPFLGPVIAVIKLVRGGFNDWAGREWSRRSVAAAVPEPDRLERLVDILATFCVAAYDEDEYGHIQAVLPSTLEALVRVRSAALDLGADLTNTAPKVSSSAPEAVRADCAAVAAIAEKGIRRIADRFGPTLTAFRFPAGIATALTEVCK